MKNKISCPECERVFEVKDISVLPNKLLEPLLIEEKYLTNEEENIKRMIEITIRQSRGLYDNFIHRNLELEYFNHFHENDKVSDRFTARGNAYGIFHSAFKEFML
jgi:hypothetical protein